MKNHLRSLKRPVLYALYLSLLFVAACAPPSSEEALALSSFFDAQHPPCDASPSILSINELLFDPLGDGVDFVEVVNVSSDSLQMSRFRLANRNSKGEVANVKALASKLLPPGAYLLLCSDTARLAQDYVLPDSANVLIVKTMPSYANAGGYVVLLDEHDAIVDEFPYDADYHHPLVSDAESLSLEKLHPSLSSFCAASWTTAALDAGGATPGYVNSQYRDYLQESLSKEGCFMQHDAFCPQALSAASQLVVTYAFDDVYVASLVVYDAAGLACAHPYNNVLLGSRGCLVWNGLDDEGNILFPGVYFLVIEAFTSKGNTYEATFVLSLWPP